MKKYILLFVVTTFSFIVFAQDKQQPNILFIMSDDHASQAIGVYGGYLQKLNPTPNLDKLANNGILFKNAFCTNSICTPSRASIISGQYPQTNGVLDLDNNLDTSKQYLPKEMKRLGYTTAMIGKWHLKNEPKNFDYYKVLPGQGNYFNPVFRVRGPKVWTKNIEKHKGHSSDVITDISIDYLKKIDKSKPFFLMHHYKAPHDMFEYAPRYKEYLKNTEIPEPASMYNQPYFGSEATRGKNDSLRHYIGTSVSPRHQVEVNKTTNYTRRFFGDSLSASLGTHKAYQKYLKDYLRCVKGIDDNLGRLFDFLKKEKLWDNTIIIYTGDQGMMLGAHDFIDKRWMYEEAMRMPFIVHYPKKIAKNQKTDLLVNNTDFAPTMIDLAGGKTPKYMQGHSFKNTLFGQKENNWRESTYYRYWMHIVHHYVPAHFGIRTKQYKLLFFYGAHHETAQEYAGRYWTKNTDGVERETPHTWEFYDLKNDPNELHNRYNDPKYKDIIEKLKIDLQKQRKDLKETDKNYPRLQKIIKDNWDN